MLWVQLESRGWLPALRCQRRLLLPPLTAAAAHRCRRSPLPPLHPPLAGNVLMGAAFYSLIFMLIGVRKSASETMQLN